MIIYKDNVTGNELFTSVYGVKEEGSFFVFPGKHVTRRDGEIDDSLLGGNASAEEPQEQAEGCTSSGLNFALDNRLEELQFDGKKHLLATLKEYMSNLQKKLHGGKDKDCDEVKEFQRRANEFVKMLVGFHKDIVAYYGERDEEKQGTCCFARYLEDGLSVEVYVFKDGIDCEKC